MPEIVKPMDIEKRSFEIITELLGDRRLPPEVDDAPRPGLRRHVRVGHEAPRLAAQPAQDGLVDPRPGHLGVGDDIAPVPQGLALFALFDLIAAGKVRPALVIGAPVGFVNVVESKERIMAAGVPYIVAQGRKGGSNVAAAICNAMLYQIAR